MLAVLAALAMLFALTIPAIAVGTESGFEDHESNLAPNPAALNFELEQLRPPVTWTGTAPPRT
jgi:hypothetical protein